MVQSLKNIKQNLFYILTKHQIEIKSCPFESISSQSILGNDNIIDSLISEHNTQSIDINTEEIKVVNFTRINEYYNQGYCIFEKPDGSRHYAINNLTIIKEKNLESNTENSIYLIANQDLTKMLERDFQEENTHFSINHLLEKLPNASAKIIDYKKMVSGAFIIFFSTFFLFFNAFNIINNLSYLSQSILKIILFKFSLAPSQNNSPIADINNDLPIYSILIPLYKEEFKVRSILKSMENMNYPKDKLDVKIIIEADDIMTIRALSIENLPSYVHVIKVPYSLPRTKPKAMNYAISYAKGEIVAVYDAEDRPDPDQLLKAVYAFNNLSDNFVCVQAKLNFYNKNENLLTRFFSLEYSIWFEYLLKGLSILNLPVTLGGTSNHFKIDKLKEVGYWDAYNVTEDADLGIRLYLSGYKVHLINSTTIEESVTNVSTWIFQRSRWIKGFIQTIYVFIKAKKDLKKFSLAKILSVYIFVGLSTYSFFCLPWILFSLTFKMDKYIHYIWYINSIVSFSYMYIISYFVLIKDKKTISRLLPIDWIVLICWPLYFLLHTIASYIAIWEVVISPFKWNKTPHGKSSDLVK